MDFIFYCPVQPPFLDIFGDAKDTAHLTYQERRNFVDDVATGKIGTLDLCIDHADLEKAAPTGQWTVIPNRLKIGRSVFFMLASDGTLGMIGQVHHENTHIIQSIVDDFITRRQQWGGSLGTDVVLPADRWEIISKYVTHVGLTTSPDYGDVPRGATWIQVAGLNPDAFYSKFYEEIWKKDPGMYMHENTRQSLEALIPAVSMGRSLSPTILPPRTESNTTSRLVPDPLTNQVVPFSHGPAPVATQPVAPPNVTVPVSSSHSPASTSEKQPTMSTPDAAAAAASTASTTNTVVAPSTPVTTAAPPAAAPAPAVPGAVAQNPPVSLTAPQQMEQIQKRVSEFLRQTIRNENGKDERVYNPKLYDAALSLQRDVKNTMNSLNVAPGDVPDMLYTTLTAVGGYIASCNDVLLEETSNMYPATNEQHALLARPFREAIRDPLNPARADLNPPLINALFANRDGRLSRDSEFNTRFATQVASTRELEKKVKDITAAFETEKAEKERLAKSLEELSKRVPVDSPNVATSNRTTSGLPTFSAPGAGAAGLPANTPVTVAALGASSGNSSSLRYVIGHNPNNPQTRFTPPSADDNDPRTQEWVKSWVAFEQNRLAKSLGTS